MKRHEHHDQIMQFFAELGLDTNAQTDPFTRQQWLTAAERAETHPLFQGSAKDRQRFVELCHEQAAKAAA